MHALSAARAPRRAYSATETRDRDGDTFLAVVQVPVQRWAAPGLIEIPPAPVKLLATTLTLAPLVVPGLPDPVQIVDTIGEHIVVRLARCNAPELSTPAGVAAKAWTEAWLAAAHADQPGALLLTPTGLDRYGRVVCEVVRTSDGHNLSDDLMAAGQAVPYRPKLSVVFTPAASLFGPSDWTHAQEGEN